jgi:hypothetical protein
VYFFTFITGGGLAPSLFVVGKVESVSGQEIFGKGRSYCRIYSCYSRNGGSPRCNGVVRVRRVQALPGRIGGHDGEWEASDSGFL